MIIASVRSVCSPPVGKRFHGLQPTVHDSSPAQSQLSTTKQNFTHSVNASLQRMGASTDNCKSILPPLQVQHAGCVLTFGSTSDILPGLLVQHVHHSAPRFKQSIAQHIVYDFRHQLTWVVSLCHANTVPSLCSGAQRYQACKRAAELEWRCQDN